MALRNILIIFSPFFIMIMVNESTRKNNSISNLSKDGIITINLGKPLPYKCTWECYNSTNYCKKHHVKFLKPYFKLTDTLYFGMIKALASTGNYSFANILFLVLLTPITIFYFLIKSLNIQDEIDSINKKNGTT